jgi:hypothetical protein
MRRVPMPDAIITQDVADLVERLNEDAMRLSGSSIDRGCADCGLAANLAAEAANLLEQQAQTLSRVREALERLIEYADLVPKETPAAGGASTEHNFKIAAGVIWTLDQRVEEAREAIRSLPALPCSGGEPYDPNLIDLPSASTEP